MELSFHTAEDFMQEYFILLSSAVFAIHLQKNVFGKDSFNFFTDYLKKYKVIRKNCTSKIKKKEQVISGGIRRYQVIPCHIL